MSEPYDLYDAENALAAHTVDCITLTRSGSRGFQVNVRVGDGWHIFYGHDIAETMNRALNNGPQYVEDVEPQLMPAKPIDWVTVTAVPPNPVIQSRLASALTFLLNYNEDDDCEPTPGGVPLAFDSSKW